MKLIIRSILIIGFFPILAGNLTAEAQQAKPVIKEMIIEVKPRTIALPGGEAGKNIAKVPIKNARIRNTELRDLNKFYNAVSIERIYEIANSAAVPAGQINAGKSFKSKKKSRLEGKRIARKTSEGFYESESVPGDGGKKISADKRIKFKKKNALELEKRLSEEEPAVSKEDIMQVYDMYIVGFQDYKDANGKLVSLNMDQVAAAYNALAVVISAEKN